MNPDYQKKLASLGVHFGIIPQNDNKRRTNQTSSAFTIEGERSTNSLGEFFFKQNNYSNGYEHGQIKFSNSFFSDETVKFPDQSKFVNFKHCIFIDTETTGLSQVGGTFAFMDAVGFVFEKQFILRQYFLIDPSEEDAMLLDLLNLLDQFDTLVSYNGISF
ncbi:MAG TPA: ribonuclease H-like domain-containing protein, partial [Anaerolineaceae bacterium]|nr:ribonuclease H-like domain-containing protein [Anaerolineaceae bacterium]